MNIEHVVPATAALNFWQEFKTWWGLGVLPEPIVGWQARTVGGRTMVMKQLATEWVVLVLCSPLDRCADVRYFEYGGAEPEEIAIALNANPCKERPVVRSRYTDGPYEFTWNQMYRKLTLLHSSRTE